MIGTYRTYEVKVVYRDTIELFIPDGEYADEIIETAVAEMVEHMPDEVCGFCYDEEEYREIS